MPFRGYFLELSKSEFRMGSVPHNRIFSYRNMKKDAIRRDRPRSVPAIGDDISLAPTGSAESGDIFVSFFLFFVIGQS